MTTARDDPAPYRVLIEDRLAFEVEGLGLDAVLVDIDERLHALGPASPDADLAVWRIGRVEAVAQWRGGRIVGVTRFDASSRRRPRVTIGALMLVILVCAPVLAALRTRQGVTALGEVVMLGLLGAIAGSCLMSIHHIVAFFRDASHD